MSYKVEFSRDGSTFDPCGLVAGGFTLNPSDRLRITYAIVPAVAAAYPL